VAGSAAPPSELERILSALRARGGRTTTSRRAVVQALLVSPGHVTAEELGAQVRAALPDLDQSTVYRALNALEDIGIVQHVHLGHGPAVYHLSGEVHAHIVCQRCGAVAEIPGSTLDRLSRDLLHRTGYALGHQHFSITGTCDACRG
jgi:Fur family transcriptional regulator, ferric uptake regulator